MREYEVGQVNTIKLGTDYTSKESEISRVGTLNKTKRVSDTYVNIWEMLGVHPTGQIVVLLQFQRRHTLAQC